MVWRLDFFSYEWISIKHRTALDTEWKAEQREGKLEWMVRTTAKYQPLLLVAQVQLPAATVGAKGESHLVVVERPYFELAKKLPAAFHRGARYGA